MQRAEQANQFISIVQSDACLYCSATEKIIYTNLEASEGGWAEWNYFLCSDCGRGYRSRKGKKEKYNAGPDWPIFFKRINGYPLQDWEWDYAKYHNAANYPELDRIHIDCEDCGEIYHFTLMAEYDKRMLCLGCRPKTVKYSQKFLCPNCKNMDLKARKCNGHQRTFNKIINNYKETLRWLNCEHYEHRNIN